MVDGVDEGGEDADEGGGELAVGIGDGAAAVDGQIVVDVEMACADDDLVFAAVVRRESTEIGVDLVGGSCVVLARAGARFAGFVDEFGVFVGPDARSSGRTAG